MLTWTRRRSAAVLCALALVAAPAAAHAAPTPADAAGTDATGAGTGAEEPGTADGHGGWNDEGCTPSPEHPRPVVLVHGTLGNKTTNWVGLAPYLADRGFCVHSFDYGALPHVPVLHGLGPIEESAVELADFVDEVLAETGAAEVDLVGHSQGGMMPRHYLKHDPEAAGRVNALVAIAPSNNGTTLSGLTTLLEIVPGAEEIIDLTAPALTQQVVGSDFLTELNADGYTVPGVEYTVLATRFDQVVTPYENAFMAEEGVRNVLMQDRCPLNVSAHLGIALVDRVTFHEVVHSLYPEHHDPATCRSAVG